MNLLLLVDLISQLTVRTRKEIESEEAIRMTLYIVRLPRRD